MYFHSKIPSSFLHSFILSFQFPSMRLLPYFLPCFHAIKINTCMYTYEVITIFGINLYIIVVLNVLASTNKFQVSEASISAVKALVSCFK